MGVLRRMKKYLVGLLSLFLLLIVSACGAKETILELETQLSSYAEENEAFQTEVDKLRKSLEENETNINDLDHLLAEKEIEELIKEVSNKDSEINNLKEQTSDVLSAQVKDLENKVKDKKQYISELEKEIKDLLPYMEVVKAAEAENSRLHKIEIIQ